MIIIRSNFLHPRDHKGRDHVNHASLMRYLVRNNWFSDWFSLSDIPVILHHSLYTTVPFLPDIANRVRNVKTLEVWEKVVNES